jgi:hypothetical protein
MRKKRKKGLLETFCLVLRQCLVLQIRLDLKRDFLTVVLVEGVLNLSDCRAFRKENNILRL